MAPDELRFLCAAFDRLVLLYPREFRRLFASDMVPHFRRSANAAFRRGGRSRLYLFAFQTFFGVLAAAIAEQLRRRRNPATARRGETMSGWNQDLRFATRALSKSPAFTVLAVLTLGLGIAVNTTIFSLVSTLLFTELPLNDPDDFVFIWAANERAGESKSGLSLPDVAELRREARSLSAVVFAMEESLLIGGTPARRAVANRVTADFFEVWGVGCVLGRCFLPGEDRSGASPVALVSHGFWERELGADPKAIGTVLRLDGRPTPVVGVVSPRMEFGGLAEVEIWIPIGAELETAPRGERVAFTQARLESGVSVAEASRELETIAERLERDHPENAGYGFRVSTVSDELLNESDRSIFVVLSLSVALVLLIACANVANMVMARATTRAREIALRLALGARRSRILRGFAAEALVLSVLAGLLGLVLARALLDFLVHMTAGRTWILSAAEIDHRVLAFTVGISLLTPLLFALAPSLRASRPDLAANLKEGARAGTALGALRSRGLLVMAQIAMALTLMITTGLLARTVYEFKTGHLGFEIEDVAAATIELSHSRREGDVPRFYETLVARAAETSGSHGASVVSPLPLTATGQRRAFLIEGAEPLSKDEEAPSAYLFVAGTGYLRVMGIPLLAGREFSSSDTESSPPVALLSKTAIDRYFSGEMVLGKRVHLVSDEADRWIDIVGVVGDVVHLDDNLPRAPQLYLPFAQNPSLDATLVARTTEPALFAESLRAQVEALGADEALAGVRTMREIRDEEFANANAIIALFAIFAGFALVMASMGIYAVMSYAVSQRERELSIRLALGAKRNDVLRMVVLQGAKLSMVGIAAGLLGAFALSRILDGVVFGMSIYHPGTYVLVTVVLAAVALVSNYAPARRATRLDPIAALRAE